MTLPTIPSDLTSREFLRIGGGYGSPAAGTSPAGGLDADNAGNLAASGDVTLDGDLRVGGQVAEALVFNNDLRQGASGVDKTWFTTLLPGAGIEASTAGAVTVYSVNAHQKLTAIPFDDTTQENAVVNFALPPDYDGSSLSVTIFWTSPDSGLSGDAHWKLYGPNDAAGDGESMNQTVGVGTGLRCQNLDSYQGQWLLHAAETSMSLGGDPGGFFAGSIFRAVDTSPIAGDALLLGIRIAYA